MFFDQLTTFWNFNLVQSCRVPLFATIVWRYPEGLGSTMVTNATARRKSLVSRTKMHQRWGLAWAKLKSGDYLKPDCSNELKFVFCEWSSKDNQSISVFKFLETSTTTTTITTTGTGVTTTNNTSVMNVTVSKDFGQVMRRLIFCLLSCFFYIRPVGFNFNRTNKQTNKQFCWEAERRDVFHGNRVTGYFESLALKFNLPVFPDQVLSIDFLIDRQCTLFD